MPKREKITIKLDGKQFEVSSFPEALALAAHVETKLLGEFRWYCYDPVIITLCSVASFLGSKAEEFDETPGGEVLREAQRKAVETAIMYGAYLHSLGRVTREMAEEALDSNTPLELLLQQVKDPVVTEMLGEIARGFRDDSADVS